jgi:hypothetical protein
MRTGSKTMRAAMTETRLVGNSEIWRAARALILQHGQEAPTRAARLADEMKTAGDTDGFRAWIRVMQAATEMLRKEREPGELVH